jgi:hypothetical protein
MKGQAPGAFDGSVPAVMPVTENGTGAGTGTVGGVMAGSVIAGGGGSLNVIQPEMRASNSDRERKRNLFNVVTSQNMLPVASARPSSHYILRQTRYYAIL